MHRALEAILGFPRKTWRTLLAEASALRVFLADVRRFASRRWRARKRGALADPNAFERALSRIINDSANDLILDRRGDALPHRDQRGPGAARGHGVETVDVARGLFRLQSKEIHGLGVRPGHVAGAVE